MLYFISARGLAIGRHAGRIIVIGRGRIQAVRTHQKFLRANGIYVHLARLQFTEQSITA